jgi:UDP-GlcNAc:undecaprenyl-phosphate GlcNAc-1-phosphate transferase
VPFVIAFALAAGAMPLVILAGRATGLEDQPSDDGLKIHRRPVPLTGGVAVTAATLVSAWVFDARSGWAAAAVALALLVGLADDARSVPAWSRAAGQAISGALLVAAGLRLDPLGPLAAVGVVVAVMACANAVNLVDGQDGLAGGLAVIASAGLLLLMPEGDGSARALAAAMIGSLAAFLLWNRPPARVFLGNGGAYAVGTVLAVLASRVAAQGWPELLAAGICLGVFAYELTSTVLRRALQRRSLVAGDRGHAYDLAARVLGSRGRSTALFLGAGTVSLAAAMVAGRGSMSVAVWVTAAYVAVVVVAGVLLQRPPVQAMKEGSG